MKAPQGIYEFALPADRIARYPRAERDASLLMGVFPSSGEIKDLGTFSALEDQLHAGDLLVLNDTRVFPARLWARRASGGVVEIVVLALAGHEIPALIRPLTRLRDGEELLIGDVTGGDGAPGSGARIILAGRQPDGTAMLRFPDANVADVAARWGEPPIPPYLKRRAESVDRERYQTVFAREPGAVAAPTAALHITPAFLERVKARGIRVATLTLHVGYGTFAPVTPDQTRLHAETYHIMPDLPALMYETRSSGGRVVAVGTTVVRTLETWAMTGELSGSTDIFLKPGHRFRAVDSLVTNFHLPGSSLLMLVHAFAGDLIFTAYAHALAGAYRFFSYGDAMFIPQPAETAHAA